MTKPQPTTLILRATGKPGRLGEFVKRTAATRVPNS
jgi:hypothetical protein